MSDVGTSTFGASVSLAIVRLPPPTPLRREGDVYIRVCDKLDTGLAG